ncbi:MAG: DMT family transporter [Thermovirgaceae bacterium]
MKNDTYKGLSSILLAGVLWGTMSPVGKTLAGLGTDMLTVAVLRAAVMAFAIGLFLLFANPSALSISPRAAIPVALVSAVSIPGIYAAFFLALETLTVPLAVVIFFSHPLLTAVGSAFVAKEPPKPVHIAAALITLAGVAIAIFPGFQNNALEFSWRGVFWSMLASTGMALYSLSGRYMTNSKSMSQLSFFFYAQVFGTFWLLLLKTFSSGWADLVLLTRVQLLWILYLSLIGSFIGYSLYFFALRSIQAPAASVVSSIEIVTAFALSAIALKSPPASFEILGGLMIVAAIAVVSCESSRRNRTIPPG